MVQTEPVNEQHSTQLGMVGLGRMGASMVRRLMAGGHRCVVHDVSQPPIDALVADGAVGASSAAEMVGHDHRRRQQLLPRRHRRAGELATKGIHYVDVGTIGRRVRSRARLLPDDRRRGRARRPPDGRSSRRLPRASTPPSALRTHRRPDAGRGRLAPLRPGRRRPLRQDGAQRHRVRPDGGVRRGAQHPAPRQRRLRRPRSRRRDDPAAPSRALPYDLDIGAPSPRCGAAARSWPRGCSTSPPRRSPRSRAVGVRRSGVRLGRGPLDGARRGRRGRAGAGAHVRAVFALQLARRGRLRRQVLSAMRKQFGGHDES
jgi:hypothetical protein